jgi:hypothetical protein
MLRAAFEMQYSARAVEDTAAEMEVMKTIDGRTPSFRRRARLQLKSCRS